MLDKFGHLAQANSPLPFSDDGVDVPALVKHISGNRKSIILSVDDHNKLVQQFLDISSLFNISAATPTLACLSTHTLLAFGQSSFPYVINSKASGHITNNPHNFLS